MSEFIGSRISLISKSDIRYVGTLHEISSENSTVALEQVVSHGTEGRRSNTGEEIAASDSVYEYIVFRGSDVKDLRIEEPPKENKPPKPPQVPDDPAILGSGSRPAPSQAPQAPQAPPYQQRQPQPPQFQQPPPFPYYYPPHPGQRYGPQGPQAFPPGPGFPGMPYGAPPGWYPPPGQGFPQHPGPFGPPQLQTAPLGQQRQGPQPPQPLQLASVGPSMITQPKPPSQQQSPEKKVVPVKLPSQSTTPAPGILPAPAQKGPPPPIESKPDVATALAPPVSATTQASTFSGNTAPTGPKSAAIMPAVPLPSPGIKASTISKGPLQASSGNTTQPSTNAAPPSNPRHPSQAAAASLRDATRAATAAVAAAMAKLPPAPGQKKQQGDGVDNLTKKVDEMRTNDHIRTSRQPGTGGYAAGHRGGGRGSYRGGRPHEHTKKVQVPTTDYDFQSANAKFNKQDLVKEAIASGSPVETAGEAPATNGSPDTSVNGRKGSEHSVVIPPAGGYNKSNSFFDNISSETKDRDDAHGHRPGGREWRGEEQKKNFETFGAGSVDNGYRGGFRGRGRGRAYGRGRGGFGGLSSGRGGRGSFRGGRGAIGAET
ncbi:MAG: hypothetical protein M1830_002916 [Pleopsidium flavum]|nr:MAG: hypothetical protein M1830_002916 [Pleopsidium flavum]